MLATVLPPLPVCLGCTQPLEPCPTVGIIVFQNTI
jgi:hypothetical protein